MINSIKKKPIDEQIVFLDNVIKQYIYDFDEFEKRIFLSNFKQAYARYNELINTKIGNLKAKVNITN